MGSETRVKSPEYFVSISKTDFFERFEVRKSEIGKNISS